MPNAPLPPPRPEPLNQSVHHPTADPSHREAPDGAPTAHHPPGATGSAPLSRSHSPRGLVLRSSPAANQGPVPRRGLARRWTGRRVGDKRVSNGWEIRVWFGGRGTVYTRACKSTEFAALRRDRIHFGTSSSAETPLYSTSGPRPRADRLLPETCDMASRAFGNLVARAKRGQSYRASM